MLQQVMKPLELEKTVFNPLQTDQFKTSQILPTELDMRWRKRRLWGEVHDENAFAMDGISGHAGLFGSALNLAQFGQACLVQDKRLNISPAFFEQALKPQAEDSSEKRGLGVMLNLPGKSSCGDGFGARSFGHTGYTGTSLWIDPDSEVVVACLTNAVYYGRNMKMYSFRRKLHTLIHAA
jgi:CubicO group peptidase (beta-lactamase class C family)